MTNVYVGGDVTGGSGNQGSQKNEPSRKESNFDDDWNDEDGWEVGVVNLNDVGLII